MTTPKDCFLDWLSYARPGEKYTYHTGHLAVSRDPERNPDHWETIDDLASAVMRMSDEGWVTLTQRRIGDDASHYIATRTSEAL